MWEVDAAVIGGWVGSILWPFFRISSFFLLAPILGTRLVPARIRLILSFVFTLILVPILPPMPMVEAISVAGFTLVIQQVLIGIAMALVLQVLLQLFVLAGQMIAMQMGLGFAQMVDPTNGVSVAVVSQFYLMLATLLFLVMDGHLAMIEVLVESFTILPVGAGFISNNALFSIASVASWMFIGGTLMALPAVTSLLIINGALGVITRAAPQLNIFAIGFPFMLLLGLVIIWLSMGSYLPHFAQFTREALAMMSDFIAMP